MRYIDLEHHKPDAAWLAKSDQLTKQLIALHESGDIKARNKLIDDNAKHWGEIRDWLLRFSHNKCWFSEARDKYSYLDVEHFRPKKEAKDLDGTVQDGYWWLAFDYSNLRICGNVGNRKKGGWFPLKDGSSRSMYNNRREKSEEPYLLDPTNSYDVTLIAFNEEGNAIPAPGISGWEKQRVEETIKRLKFNEHNVLTEERKRIWQEMSRTIEEYLTAKSWCSSGNNPAAERCIRYHLCTIRKMTREDSELSAVAKWCLLFRNDRQLLKLAA